MTKKKRVKLVVHSDSPHRLYAERYLNMLLNVNHEKENKKEDKNGKEKERQAG